MLTAFLTFLFDRAWCGEDVICSKSHSRANVLKQYVQVFRLSCNIQTFFYWGRKGELYTSYHIRLISQYKDLKTKVVSWFSLVIGQNASRQLATSSENLVASAQFLVSLATSESQFRTLYWILDKEIR